MVNTRFLRDSISLPSVADKILVSQDGSYPQGSIGAKFQEDISVKEAPFNAKGDGVTDDTVSIQAALDRGGTIYMPDGKYVVTSLSITKPVTLVGNEWGTIIETKSTTGNVLNIVDASIDDVGITVKGIVFETSVNRASGYFIQTSGTNYVYIDRCRFTGGVGGVRYTGNGSTGFYVTQCNFSYNTGDNIRIDPSSGGADQVISDVWILGPSSGVNSATGITVTATGDLTLRRVETVWAGNGLFIQPTSGLRIQALLVDECFFDSGSGYGIYCVTNGGNVDLLKIANTWTATNQGGTYFSSLSTGPIRQIDIVNCISANNILDGYRFGSNVTNLNMTSTVSAGNTQNGCLFDANTSLFKVIGCTFGASSEFGPNGAFGVRVQPGTSDNYIISLNRVAGNASGQISDNGSGVNKVVANNI